MEEQLILFETAILAKEKGFNIKGLFSYKQPVVTKKGTNIKEEREYKICENDLYNSFYEITYPNEDFYAPTQSLLQKWLREKHNIFVSCSYNHIVCDGTYYIWYGNMGKNCNSKEGFKTYEQALEEGLLQGLKLIK